MIRRIIFFCLIFFAATFSFADRGNDLKKLQDRIKLLQKELADIEESKSEAADALRESEQNISNVNRQLYSLSIEQKRTEATLAKVQVKAKATQVKIEKQHVLLNRLLSHQYVTSKSDSLKLLFNSQNPHQILRDLYYYGEITKFRAETINLYRKDLGELRTLTDEIKTKNAELSTLKHRQTAEKLQLIKEKQSKHKVLAAYSKQISTQRKEIGTLKRNESRLSRLIEKLRKIVVSPKMPPSLNNDAVPSTPSNGIAFSNLKGRINLPVRGELIHRFGSHRIDGGIIWKGVFIRSPSGQPVKAVANGQIVFADWLRGFGNLIIIDHGQGYMSLYANNEALYKQVGESVYGSDTIASVGNSGGNPDSGLYFELRHQGMPFDPLHWVSLK